ncbi:hypothetical protein [Streptomyces sp. NPDC017941]|uniref:hypothetical protein n=1 Tax=Streptomyces sp. NPDC017941 TaxID=3365018 RepID=UPI0037939DB8
MANTRKYDRIIRGLQEDLQAIESRDTRALSGTELARFGVAVARGTVSAGRGWSTSGADGAAARIWQDAHERVSADLRAVREMKAEAQAQAARGRMGKRFG